MKPHSTGRLALTLLVRLRNICKDQYGGSFGNEDMDALLGDVDAIFTASRYGVSEPRAGIAFAAMRAALDANASDPVNVLKMVAAITQAIQEAEKSPIKKATRGGKREQSAGVN